MYTKSVSKESILVIGTTLKQMTIFTWSFDWMFILIFSLHRRWLAQRHKSGRSGTSGQVPKEGGKGRNVFTSGYADVQRECRFSINN